MRAKVLIQIMDLLHMEKDGRRMAKEFRTVMAYDDSTESYGNSIPFSEPKCIIPRSSNW